ncbi:hypothetical protein BDP27DRAFT_650524 [Rhodocollybia butyracea]|uniref:BTB domain-containing protein n=1 Tax=Rhodocollybia butyracea TaxID=206335 RepID=A0A9P5TWN7_9AGAR|nr:hypothetical protein BDP27DRAFT_650524 [Rhodocollybia butyracea]
MSTYPRHNTFYQEYNYRVFLVDGMLYRIPLDILAAECDIFQAMMELPQPSSDDDSEEGLSDQNPIRLDGVSRNEFEQLLRILCPPQSYRESPPQLSFLQLVSVLKLADQWCMDAVKEHVVLNIDQFDVDPVDKIVLARKFNVRSWLTPSFNRIVQRSTPLTKYDLDKLGAETLLKLVEFRDRLRCDRRGTWTIGTKREYMPIDFAEVIEAELPDFPQPSAAATVATPDAAPAPDSP